MTRTNENERTGYIFFLEWEYYKRRAFLQQVEQLRNLHKQNANEKVDEIRIKNKYKKAVQCYPNLAIMEALEEIFQKQSFVKSKSYGKTYESYDSDAISKVTFYELVIDYETYYFAIVCFKNQYSPLIRRLKIK